MNRKAKRRTRKQLRELERIISSAADWVSNRGPELAQQLGLIEPPKPKRTLPRVATGAVVGATVTYFLEPGAGPSHRRQVQRLVSRVAP